MHAKMITLKSCLSRQTKRRFSDHVTPHEFDPVGDNIIALQNNLGAFQRW